MMIFRPKICTMMAKHFARHSKLSPRNGLELTRLDVLLSVLALMTISETGSGHALSSLIHLLSSRPSFLSLLRHSFIFLKRSREEV